MKKCPKCKFCRKKEKKDGTLYSCNIAGMLATGELLPEECDRFRKKKVDRDV